MFRSQASKTTAKLDQVPTSDLIALRNLVCHVRSELIITAEQSGDDLNTTFLLHSSLADINSRLALTIMGRNDE